MQKRRHQAGEALVSTSIILAAFLLVWLLAVYGSQKLERRFLQIEKKIAQPYP